MKRESAARFGHGYLDYHPKDTRKPDLLIKPSYICVEVGVAKGNHAEHIIYQNPRELHLIDPWGVFKDGFVPPITENSFEERYQNVCERFKNDKNVLIHRAYSDKVCATFEDESIDWVYIDGNHTYEGTLEDLHLWWPKLKTGGYLTGDDYAPTPNPRFGVVKAVNEFVKEFGLIMHTSPFEGTCCEGQFIIEKLK